ncbi:hypothetical protein FPZ24_08245 [Sphingomonas panacisoli]|uniref:Uncharacterized protein n=1 Tax=Sphingomonas panacisoli TaxID=1813879 RepID=A0A5B8LHA5_9SPHN|nr:hypothetical protein [Sphingomonas panacisoli]QDZ07473.1 hypothetical protein FPZ24_08245 [Sphingomonas panacisoli]
MTDAFASYGEAAAPIFTDPRANRRKKDPSALDLKMEEKGRLLKAYKAMRRKLRIEILAEEPRLLNLMRYLRSVGPDDGDELLAAIGACDWLMTAPQNVRAFALERIRRREDKIKLMMGERPLDDPLPPELGGRTTVFFEAQKLLRKGGVL